MALRIAKIAAADLSVRFLLLDQIHKLQRMGHEVVAICAPGEWVQDIRERGVTVETVDIRRELSPIADLRALRELVRLFRRYKFDVVHTHTPKAGLLGPLAARLAGTEVVLHTIHGLLFHDHMPRWRRWLFWLPEKWTATFCDYLLSQSSEDIDVAVRTGLCRREKLLYIGNGIDTGSFSPDCTSAWRQRIRQKAGIADGDIVVGSVGRLVFEKGFQELFDAAPVVSARNTNIRFVIVGPSEDNRQSDALPPETVRNVARSSRVTFTGWIDEMACWYAAMDIFVLPSHREGIPRACMEAAAMGLPVIASDIRGCREVVKDGETGMLVPVRNAAALADAIAALAADPEMRQRMGSLGRRHIVANFNQTQVLERLRKIYEALPVCVAARCSHA